MKKTKTSGKLLILVFIICFTNVSLWDAAKADVVYTYIYTANGLKDSINISYVPKFNQTEARSMLKKINNFRTGGDAWYWNYDNTEKIECGSIHELKYDYDLEKAAMQRAAEIALYYDHTRPDGRGPFTVYDDIEHYEPAIYAENIACGLYVNVNDAFRLWREDKYGYSGQGHRRAMLDAAYNTVGIACVTIGETNFWVQEFSSDVFNEKETEAVDTEVQTNVHISASLMDFVSAENEGIKVAVGRRIRIPSINATVKMTGSHLWENTVNISVPNVYNEADNEYVSIDRGTIVGLKAGTGHVTGTLLGEELSLEVTVYESDDPNEPDDEPDPIKVLEPYIPEPADPLWVPKISSPDPPAFVAYGDVNSSGTIDSKDVTLLSRYLAGGWDAEIDIISADVNGDSNVDAKDVTLLRRYLAGGWDISFPENEDFFQTGVVYINKLNFPDDYFRKYVSDSFDIDKNGKLDEEEIKTVTSINCSPSKYLSDDELDMYSTHYILYRDYFPEYLDDEIAYAEEKFWSEGNGIKSLKGIEYFTSLEELRCRYNQISEMDLSCNTELIYLDFRNNNIQNVEITNKKLTSDNMLYDEDVLGILGNIWYYYDNNGNITRSDYLVRDFIENDIGKIIYSEEKYYYPDGQSLSKYTVYYTYNGYHKAVITEYDEGGDIVKETLIYSFDDGSRLEENYRFSDGEKELYQISTRNIYGKWKYETL